MNKSIVAVIALASTLLSFNTFAGTPGKVAPNADNHVYAEVSGGYSKINSFDYRSFGLSELDDSGFAFSVRLGMNFATDSSWGWGYELGYFNLARAEANGDGYISCVSYRVHEKIKVKQQGVDLLLTLNKQFNEKVSAFGKAGIAYVGQDLSAELQGNSRYGNASTDGSNVLPEIAGGVAFNLTDSIALTGTVNHLFGKSLNIDSTTNDVASSTSGMIGLRVNIT